LNAHHSKSLFYNKYTHKVAVAFFGLNYLRYSKFYKLDNLYRAETYQQYLKSPVNISWHSYSSDSERNAKDHRDLWKNRFHLFHWVQFLNKCKTINASHSIRIEDHKMSFFCSDEALFEEACRISKDTMTGLAFPKDDKHKQFLLENPDYEICESLPFNHYRFRMELRNHRIASEKMPGFIEWVREYKGDIRINTHYSAFGHQVGKFLYSTNKEMMLLLQMYLGDKLKKTTTFITEKEIDEK